MALTAWEALKVVGGIVSDLGAKAEVFEDENPEEKFKMTKDEVISLVVEVIKQIGVEVMD